MDIKDAEILGGTQNRIYVAPHPALERYVAHYTLNCRKEVRIGRALNLVPDASGCVVFTRNAAGVREVVWGPTTKMVTVCDDGLERFFIEFRPGGLSALLGEHSALADSVVEGGLVCAGLAEISRRMEEGASLAELSKLADALLLSRLPAKDAPAGLIGAMEAIRLSGGAVTAAKLSKCAFYSQRQLYRLFCQNLGMGVKAYINLCRVNTAVKLLNGGHTPAQTAAIAGYYDEAHFIHGFKAVCGVTPGIYLSKKSDFYNEIYKY